jgi:hypothetical protein
MSTIAEWSVSQCTGTPQRLSRVFRPPFSLLRRTRTAKQSPYLEHPQRLADILAAIQVMGTHVWDTRPVEHWSIVLGEAPRSVPTHKWEDVFERHPEFFGKEIWKRKLEEEGKEVFTYYLRWRRARERTINPDTLGELTNAEIEELKKNGKYNETRLARKTLTPAQIQTLLRAAIELQVRAIDFTKQSRWWLPIASGALGFLGAIAGAMLKTA